MICFSLLFLSPSFGTKKMAKSHKVTNHKVTNLSRCVQGKTDCCFIFLLNLVVLSPKKAEIHRGFAMA